jgi:hypothetical protein
MIKENTGDEAAEAIKCKKKMKTGGGVRGFQEEKIIDGWCG